MPIGSGWSFRVGGRSWAGVGKGNGGIPVAGSIAFAAPSASRAPGRDHGPVPEHRRTCGAAKGPCGKAWPGPIVCKRRASIVCRYIGEALAMRCGRVCQGGPVRVALRTYGTPPSLQREPLLSVGDPFFGRSLHPRAATGFKGVGDVPTHAAGWSPALHLHFNDVRQRVNFSPSRRIPILCSRP